jgi:hypothetical protein
MKTWITNMGLSVLLAGSAFLCLPASVLAADMTFKPFVSVSEEVNDNIFETPTGRRTEYTTRIMPGASFHYLSPFWTWDVAYTFSYLNYARKSTSDNFLNDAAVTGKITPLENFLFLELSENYHRVSLNVSQNPTTQSSLFLNQTDQNLATVSPYLVWRLRGDNTLKTGYRFTDTRYFDSIGIDSQQHSGFADLTHEFTSKFSISADYMFTRLVSVPTRYNKHDLYGGFRYEYADKSFVYGKLGNTWQEFDDGASVSYLIWNAGVTHVFGTFVATVETNVAAAVDPLSESTKTTSYSGRLEKSLPRGMLGLSASYTEYANTQTNLTNQTLLGIMATGRHELIQDLTANLSLTYEHFTERIVPVVLASSDYPYRFTAVAGLNYALKNELTLGLTYTYNKDLLALDTTAGSIQINKAMLELRKSF